MPSALPLPSIADLLRAFDDAVIGQKDARANVRRGSCYDHFAGIGAILFSRQAQRDSDLFRAIYFDTADGDDLTNVGAARFAATRSLDTTGTGLARLTRPTTAGAGGTVYAGTRISVISLVGMSEPRTYIVTSDTPVGPGDLSSTVPIRASTTGAGVAVAAVANASALLRLDDPLWDATLLPSSVTCGDGATFEPAKDFRARVRQSRLDVRTGYPKAIVTAFAAVGAATIVMFPSNYTGNGNDYGLNMIYVADASFAATPALLQACTVAVDSIVVFGTQVQVLPLATSALTVQALVTLWDDPGSFNLPSVRYELQQALVGYFDGRANAFTYRLDAMAGAMQSASAAVQSVSFVSPSADLTLTTGTPPQFPSTLTRITLSPASVLLSFQGPQ